MPGTRRRVSMADVAELAGVSPQTVSRVANGYEGVVPATRAKVVEAMRTLGYRPNAAARALKRGSFQTIGLVMFDLNAVGNSATLAAINELASRAGYAVTVITEPSRTSQAVAAALGRLEQLAVDGVITIIDALPDDGARLSFDVPSAPHLVVVDPSLSLSPSSVDTDQAGGTRQAVEHLLGLGHRTVHHVTGPERSCSAAQRLHAWRQVLTEHGAPVPEPVHGDWSAGSGYRAGRALLEGRTEEVTAVFCANDEMSLGLIRAAHDLGLSVPEDVSVVGFDDIATSAEFLPPLTTVHQDFQGLGKACLDTLLSMINAPAGTGAAPSRPQIVPTHLVVRESTAPPRR